MLLKTARPSSTALTMLAKLSQQHHVGGLLGHVSPRDTHRDSDVRAL